MAIAVLPRATAATVINQAVARGTWAVALTLLVFDVPALLDVFFGRGLQDRLALPLIALMGMIGALALTALRPLPWRVALYLLVAGVCVTAYELGILTADASLAVDATYLLNRPAVAIVLVGALGSTTLLGVLWCALGYAVSVSASFIAARIAGEELHPGLGPTILFAAYVTAYLTLALIQRAQRRRVPDFDVVEQESDRIAAERESTLRTAAVVHDTVLNDLAFIINAPDTLDDRARERLRSDVATLTSPDWLEQHNGMLELNRSNALVRNRLAAVVSELQWRGLTVHVSGNGSAALQATDAAAVAAVDAARACLENVLAHSGAVTAQIVLGQEDGESTIMVIDEGSGFDPDAVPHDRLGLRVSVVQRVEAVGGYVRVWSSPGNGTSVLISVPATEVSSAEVLR